MGTGADIPWVGGRYTMDRRVKIPWVEGGQNAMGKESI